MRAEDGAATGVARACLSCVGAASTSPLTMRLAVPCRHVPADILGQSIPRLPGDTWQLVAAREPVGDDLVPRSDDHLSRSWKFGSRVGTTYASK
jgi:hypothetical protein